MHILLGKIDYEIGECLLTRQQGEVNKIALSVKLSVHESYKEVITRVMFLWTTVELKTAEYRNDLASFLSSVHILIECDIFLDMNQ